MDTLLFDYEESLLKNEKKNIRDFDFFGTEPGGANQYRALAIIRYAIEKVLEWDVETAISKFDEYIIQVMKLDQFTRFINYPVEIPDGNPRYILSLLYPQKVRINYQNLVIDLYKQVLDNQASFPREYFLGVNGYYRFCICLQYLIESYHPVLSLDELYKFISSSEGNSFLLHYRLKIPAEQLQIDIFSCIYEITKNFEDAELYYCYYTFQRERNKALFLNMFQTK